MATAQDPLNAPSTNSEAGTPTDPLIPSRVGATVAPGPAGRRPVPSVSALSPVAPGAVVPGRLGSAPCPAGGSGRGFTAKEIFFGYGTLKSVNTIATAVGFNDISFGDQEAHARIAADDVNKRGGICGRKISLVFYDFTPPGGSSAAQAACDRWTQDQPVFAVVNIASSEDQEDHLIGCLARRRTPLVNMWAGAMHAESSYTRNKPHHYSPSGVSLERYVPRWVTRLKALGYFSGWDNGMGRAGAAPVKVGLLGNSGMPGPAYFTIARKALAREGQVVASQFETSGLESSQYSAAVLRFRSAGVTHVLASDMLTLTFFTQQAESQGYRPRYGINSLNFPSVLLQTVASPRQLAGALGLGYMPTSDVDSENDPGDVGPAEARCRKANRDAGQDPSQRGAYVSMMLSCEGMNFLMATVNRGGLSAAGMAAAAQELRQLPPSSTFGISFIGGRFDGATTARDMAYRDSCGCLQYVDKINRPL